MHTFPSLLPSSLFTNQNSNYVLVPSPLPSFILMTLLQILAFRFFLSRIVFLWGPPIITLAPFRIFNSKIRKNIRSSPGGKLTAVTLAVNFPPVSLVPVIPLELRISSRIFVKFIYVALRGHSGLLLTTLKYSSFFYTNLLNPNLSSLPTVALAALHLHFQVYTAPPPTLLIPKNSLFCLSPESGPPFPLKVMKVFEKGVISEFGISKCRLVRGGRPAGCRRIKLVLLVKWPILKLKVVGL
jgi:hypothetical protein